MPKVPKVHWYTLLALLALRALVGIFEKRAGFFAKELAVGGNKPLSVMDDRLDWKFVPSLEKGFYKMSKVFRKKCRQYLTGEVFLCL